MLYDHGENVRLDCRIPFADLGKLECESSLLKMWI
tara:strand:- start:39 stop:143 length:105 start_codon:yes stop_codon:yes gene_type:complete